MIAEILKSVRRYAGQSLARRIGVAASINALLTITARAIGFIREMVVAAAFGVSGSMDAYLMAFALIGFPSAVLLNAIQSAVIPAMVSSTDIGRRRILRSTVTGVLLTMGAVLGVMLLFLPEIVGLVGWGFSSNKQREVVSLCYLFIPYYFLAAINNLGYGALQAGRRFAANGLCPATVPGITILILWSFAGTKNIEVLVWGVTAGTFVELVLLQFLLRVRNLSLMPNRSGCCSEIGTIWRQSTTLAIGTAVWAFVPIIDQILASGLGEGSIASLGYGARLPFMIGGILVTAVGVAALPYLVEMINAGRTRECGHALNRLSRILVIGGCLISGSIIFLSEFLVELIYERGEFDAEARQSVVPIQQAYAAQIPGMLIGMLATRVHIAQSRVQTLTAVTVVSAIIYGASAWWLSSHFGVVGIALTAALVSWGNGLWLYISASRHFSDNK